MGNQVGYGHSYGQDLRATLIDLPNYVHQKDLGGGKVLKTMKCYHDDIKMAGNAVVKIYIKRNENSLDEYKTRFESLRKKIDVIKHPALVPFSGLYESDKAAFLIRQYFSSNLYDRFNTPPFMTEIEKKWATFQFLNAVAQCHSIGITHGDLKTENLLVTTWDWLFLTDFAVHKPTCLPVDNPANFYAFFDSDKRRKCYVAPERFYSNQPKYDKHLIPNEVTEQMDIFSCGCVIAEIFLEGDAVFDLSRLLSYKDGKYDPRITVGKIKDPSVRELVMHMIQLDPSRRFSANQYLEEWSGKVFPSYFPFLYRFFSQFVSPAYFAPDPKIEAIKNNFEQILEKISGYTGRVPESLQRVSEEKGLQVIRQGEKSPPNERNDRKYDDEEDLHSVPRISVKDIEASTKSLEEFIENLEKLTNDVAFDPEIVAELVGDLHQDVARAAENPAHGEEGECIDRQNSGLIMVISVVCACLRNVRFPSVQLTGLELLLGLAPFVDDETRLGRLVPYTVSMLVAGQDQKREHQHGIVRAWAVQVLTKILEMVNNVSSKDATIFPDYILPSLSLLPSDPEELVRVVYALNIAKLADSARRFLDISNYTKQVSLRQTNAANISEHTQHVPNSIAPSSSANSSPSETSSGLGSFSGSGSGSGLGSGPASPEDIRSEDTPLQLHLHDDDAKDPLHPDQPSPTLECDTYQGTYDEDLAALQELVAKIVAEMLGSSSAQGSSSRVKRALLTDISRLCVFFGRQRTNDQLLPLLISVLNDSDWQLRSAFYEHIAGVAVFVGRVSVKNFILPCIEQGLTDVEEFNIQKSLETFKALTDLQLFEKQTLLEIVKGVGPLLCHPSGWIRNAAVEFVTSAADFLGPASTHCYLGPMLQVFLKQSHELVHVTKSTLLLALKPPLPRHRFQKHLNYHLQPPAPSRRKRSHKRVKSAEDILETEEHIPDVTLSPSSTLPSRFDPQQFSSASESAQSNSSRRRARRTDSPEHARSAPGTPRAPSRLSSSQISGMDSSDQTTTGLSSSSTKSRKKKNLLKKNYKGSRRDRDEDVDEMLENSMREYIKTVAQNVQNLHGNASQQELQRQAIDELKQFEELETEIPLYSIYVEPTMPGTEVQLNGPQYTDWQELVTSGEAKYQYNKRPGSPKLQSSGYNGDTLNRSQPQIPKPEVRRRDKVKDKRLLKALDIPPAPPDLGTPYDLTLSTSTFYKNRRPPYPSDPLEPSSWRPRGTLVAEMRDHRGPVNQLSVSCDNLFLASCSSDGTVKIWDCNRLERSADTSPVLSYNQQGGRITSVTVCDSSHSIASTSDNGSVHVFRIDHVESSSPYDGTTMRKTYRGYKSYSSIKQIDVSEEGSCLAVEHFNTLSESMLVYGTRKGLLHGWDLRFDREAWRLAVEPGVGLIECMAVGPNIYTLIIGTSRGFVLVWDLRFQIPVQIWRHSAKSRILTLSPFAEDSLIYTGPMPSGPPLTHPTQGPLLFVSAEDTNEISAFDLNTGECRENFRVLMSDLSRKESLDGIFNGPKHKSSRGRAVQRSNRRARATRTDATGDFRRSTTVSPLSLASMRSYPGMTVASTSLPCNLPTERDIAFMEAELNAKCAAFGKHHKSITGFLCSNGNFAITTGTDRIVRYWDLHNPPESYRVSSENPDVRFLAQNENNAIVFDEIGDDSFDEEQTKQNQMASVKKQRGPVPPPTEHQDIITDLKAFEYPQKMLATSSRDGFIKIWV